MEVQTVGDTVDGRKLYHVRMGDENAADKVLIFAGIHGREYMTTQLVMEQLGEFVENLLHEDRTYKGYSYSELLRDRALHIIPMANPDGVTVSQFGAEGMRSPGIREQVWEIADEDGARMPWKSYFRRWKSNAEGVDVNRNFDALWEEYVDGIGRPSREKYKGTAPESTKEAQALVNLTKRNCSAAQSAITPPAVSYTGHLDSRESWHQGPRPLQNALPLSRAMNRTAIMKNWTRRDTRTGRCLRWGFPV
ncbi:hypothetical protein LC724_29575 [Blautia sp. RD014234]|nr:hypothetical protein [Blautia parvula]